MTEAECAELEWFRAKARESCPPAWGELLAALSHKGLLRVRKIAERGFPPKKAAKLYLRVLVHEGDDASIVRTVKTMSGRELPPRAARAALKKVFRLTPA